MKKFLFKFPSRGRPDKFKATLVKHIECLSNEHEYKFIFSFDNDDEKMNNDNVKNFISNLDINYEIYYGDNKNKIEAINANLENQDFDILVLIADDMIPTRKNYDIIISDIFDGAPKGLDSTVHFYTARWANLLDIWNIMGKNYYDRFKYIYHPEYKSIFCDNEYTEIATILDCRIFSMESPFYHDNITDDETNNKNWQFNHEDWLVYENRKKNNYNLIIEDKKNEDSNNTRKRKTRRKQKI
jgi:hypothetical protein